MSQSPRWPNQSNRPDRPDQSPGSGSPLSRLARSRPGLTAIAIVAGVLILALSGALALVLASNAHGEPAQTRQTTNVGAAQTATADGRGNSTPTSGGGTHPTPTPTSSRRSATPTPGTPASPSVHQVVNQFTLSGFGEGSVVATCPSGEFALSGGWAVRYDSGATIYRSTRSGTRSWAVYVNHPSSTLVTSYAECLKEAPGATIAERRAQVSVAANTADRAYPKCNAGEVVVGGGFAFDLHTDVALDVFGNNSSDTQWEGQVVNLGATSTLASVYAECLAYSGASIQATAFAGSNIAAGSRGSVYSGACPSGYYQSGGAYMSLPGGAFVYDMQAQLVLSESGGSSFVWAASLYANGGHEVGLAVEAICLRF